MHYATLHMPVRGFSTIGFSQGSGLPGDIRINFRTQGNLPYEGIVADNPQLVLRPFTSPRVFAYDIEIDDVDEASGIVEVPGPVMNDQFAVEVYTRNDAGRPLRMIAAGRIDLTGWAYRDTGPLGPASYPIGPAGPVGPMGPVGPEGVRGSRWYTGPGTPTLPAAGRVEGDMWLDETNGDVWRWDGTALMWAPFRGTG